MAKTTDQKKPALQWALDGQDWIAASADGQSLYRVPNGPAAADARAACQGQEDGGNK